MPTREARRTHVEEAGLWIARVRLVVVLFAVAEVGFRHDDYPSGYETRGRPRLRDRRRDRHQCRPVPDPRLRRVVAARSLRRARLHVESRHVAVRRAGAVGFDHRLVDEPADARGGSGGCARGRSRGAARPARPAVDALEAANRCARTLPSSPDVSQAFAFAPEEVELVALLGRLVATAAQNIRAHEAEDETSRLASLVADVLDTSRIEAGTFTFTSGTSTWHSSCATSQPRPTWLRARCASGPR
jgi:hypothetical protein